MAIDITKIDGYKPEMTAEEKLALLDKYEPDLTGFVKKDTFDKTASELSDIKKQLKAKMTEEEQKEADRIAAETQLKAELEALRNEAALTKNKSKFLALGYDETLAEDTAKALVEGNMDKVFANQQAYIEIVKKAAKAANIADDPKPNGGKSNQAITKEDFGKLGYAERLKLFNESPEIYKQMIGENNNG